MKTRLGRYEVFLLILLFCLSVGAEYFEALSLLEYQTVSIRHALRSSHGDRQEMAFPLDKIVLVTIDEYFFKEYGKSPLRRADLASIIRNLGRLGARVICVDLLLDLPDAYGEDLILASALQQSRAILASRLLFDRRNRFQDISYPTPLLREAATKRLCQHDLDEFAGQHSGASQDPPGDRPPARTDGPWRSRPPPPTWG